MKKTELVRSTFREIRGSLGRYLAIFFIVALGVGFFAGLRITENAMLETGDRFMHEQEMFDYRVVSVVGATQKDVEAYKETEGVKSAEGAVSVDLICLDGETGKDYVMRAHSITESVNVLSLKAGRMPENEYECVIDSWSYGEEVIGTEIKLSENNSEDVFDEMSSDTYKIVGLVHSPYYLNFERGSSTVGGGTVTSYVYMLPSAFDTDGVYTEVFLTLDGSERIYSDGYNALLDGAYDTVKGKADERTELRYLDLKAEFDDGVSELEKILNKDFDDIELADVEELLATVNECLDDPAMADMTGEDLKNAKDALEAFAENFDELKNVKVKIAELDAMLIEYTGKGFDETELSDVEELLATVNGYLENPRIAALGGEKLLETKAALEALIENFDALKDADAKIAELDTALTDYTGKGFDETELSDVGELLDKVNGYLENPFIADIDGDKLRDAKDALEDCIENFDELKEAKEKLDGIKDDINSDAAVYALDRRTNIGYVCFENDAHIVSGVSKVFPVFFILVAALVCSTTMSRMVDEQRQQIGLLRALGYGETDIIMKYSFYSGSSALLGCVGGYAGGIFLFPWVIWEVYRIMYGFTDIIFVFDLPIAIISVAVSLICSVAVTVLSCRREFSERPAELIRPQAPKAGKRVILEYITPHIWKKMKFLHKVSARNILRYKKRLIMMIVGIGGCTALLITGFGIRDSISNIVGTQYGEITVYDGSITFRNELSNDGIEEFVKKLPEGVENTVFVRNVTADCATDASKQVELIAAEDTPEFDSYFKLERRGEKQTFDGDGETVINDKLASKLGLSVGDKLKLRWDDVNEIELTVSGIFDNYIYNYAFVTVKTLETLTVGKVPGVRTAYYNVKDGFDVHAVSAEIQGTDGVAAVNVNADMETRFRSMLGSLDYIVMLVTACAAALAFIVLYNLANINITERVREIATLKVLGFYRRETAQYVFRENLVLTAIGAFFGIFGGIALHAYVMNQIDINIVKFDTDISWISFVVSVLLTLVFGYLVNLILKIKIDKIDMAGSLKSIE